VRACGSSLHRVCERTSRPNAGSRHRRHGLWPSFTCVIERCRYCLVVPVTQRTRLASYAVAVTDGRILVCRIAPTYPAEGRWTLPGGGIDWGEHPDDALVREVHEETSLTLDSYTLAGIDSATPGEEAGRPAMHAVRFIYRCVTSGEPSVVEENGSVDAVAWVPLASLSEIPTVSVIERALQIATSS
jgi:8-oxo-dGTP diphosphatase